MKVCGIIAEYNPLHNGHVYHIQEARKLSGCDVLAAVMSGNYVQRGEPAVTDKWSRAAAAVKAGADVIMFDNRTPEEIKELVKLIPEGSGIITEASGGIRLDTISKFKGCGVDYISVGALTNGVGVLDISFISEKAVKA